ncbi:unnamed protein product, partial [Mesorhabditis belari]|uniref:DNA-directed RNA polymerase I subunit D n=1 Tax=Mesorhabditis belari TaxID=2138241 RepID=A0AAF3ELT3_9BILA
MGDDIDTSGILPPFRGTKKVEVLDASDPTMLTIVLHEEDHTIGNSLKHILCQMPDVEFCGYNVPHPLENKILLRLQTRNGQPAGKILSEAFQHLETLFKHIGSTFEEAYANSL